MVDDDDGWTPDHGHPISSPREPNSAGELKIGISLHTQIYYINSRAQPLNRYIIFPFSYSI